MPRTPKAPPPDPIYQSPLIAPEDCGLSPIPDRLRLMSWNVNGIRAVHKKGFAEFLRAQAPDMLGLQETKARMDQLSAEHCVPGGYATFWNSAQKAGYSGTAVYTRIQPDLVQMVFDEEVLNGEGRVLRVDYADVSVFTVYFPNGKMPGRLEYKLEFYRVFLDLMQRLRKQGRKIVFCGDINTAHREIDLARPDANRKVSGFMDIERAWIDEVLAAGYIDTLRMFHPDTPELYTWWDVISRARDRNIGWRIDYFFVSPDLKDRVLEAGILPDAMGSDHCPVTLTLKMA